MSFTVTPKRVVVAFPKIENAGEWARILGLRNRYDPLASAVGPHVTLVFPFEDPVPDEELHAHVEGAVAGIPSFAVTLSGITAHENEYLFLNFKRGNDEVIRLHDALYSGVLACHHERSHTFVPHITVGRLSQRELPVALENTRAFTERIHGQIDVVSVYRVEAEEVRRTLFEVRLD